jgi:NitT/TauT family transport system substrate-binding protein
MKKRSNGFVLLGLAVALSGVATTGFAADKVRVASAFRGFWDTTMIEFGKDKGIFAADGIDVEVTYTTGGSEIIQAVVSGGADVGIATGTMGAMAAIVKGAPVVISSAEFLGSSDLFYYVKADSPIKSFKDLNGKKLGIARPGSSSQSVGAILAKNNGIKVDYVATGAPTATFTAVMSGQVDAAWSVFPAMLNELEKGTIRIIGVGRDASEVNKETTRVNVASKAFADTDLAKRFFRAYKKTIDWAYSSDEAAQKYADLSKISLATAKRVITQDYPKEVLSLSKLGTVQLSIAEGVENKFLPKAPTPDEIKQMFRYVATLNP